MIQVQTVDAIRNNRTLRPFSIWANAGPAAAHESGIDMLKPDFGGERVYNQLLRLKLKPKFRCNSSDTYFAAGSCFARNIEIALSKAGINVQSYRDDLGVRPWFWNRYTSQTILADLEDAFSECDHAARLVNVAGKSYDYTTFAAPHEASALIAKRKIVQSSFQMVREAGVFIITLGLVEAWYDHQLARYLNVTPSPDFLHHPERYELRILDYNENLTTLCKIREFVREKANRRPQFIVTVSPVPFAATFSGLDVVVANMTSKSILRAAAAEFTSMFEDVDYFPSYELVMLSDPQIVWEGDRRHVRQDHVDNVVRVFIDNFIVL